MTAILGAGGAAILLADISLLTVCWKRASVLGGLLAAAGIALVGFAFATGLAGGAASLLVIALISLIIGTALYGLGQRLEHLLDEQPDEDL